MAKYSGLDQVFHALASPARRGILEQLVNGPKAMTTLAEAHSMALPSMLQHLQVLENSGLVLSQKQGRKRLYQLQPEPLLLAEHWIDKHRKQWELRLDQLANFLTTYEDNDQ